MRILLRHCVASLLSALRKRGLTLAAALVCLVVELARRRRVRPIGATYVPGHWLLAAVQKRQNELAFHQHQSFGRTLAFKVPLKPWVVRTTCPNNVEHILKTNSVNYPKGARQQTLSDLLVRCGIINTGGEEWDKTSSRIFTSKLLKDNIWSVVRRNASKLRRVFESCSPGEPVDVFNLMNSFALDSLGEIGFGKCIGSIDDPSSPLLESFAKAQQIALERFGQPLWKSWRFLFCSGTERETSEHIGRLDAYSRSIVSELLRHAASDDKGCQNGTGSPDVETRKHILGMFLEDTRKRGETVTEDHLRDAVLNFLFAGGAAIAEVISWAVYCLSRYPKAQAGARTEVIDACGVRGPNTHEDISRLPYLHAVIREALRLYPAVPADGSLALLDDTWPDGTFIPRGTAVLYDIYSMGRDRAIWGEDAEVFRPERWLEMKARPSGSYECPVFNTIGPCECLGMDLAMLEMNACLAMALPQLTFQLAVPCNEIETDAQLTIGFGRGLPCCVTKTLVADANVSTTVQSDCETVLSENTGETTSSEAGSYTECSESATDTASSCSQASPRHRKKKRKSGWSRRRQSM